MFGLGAPEIMTLIFIIALFMVCREVVCWYWKQNEQVKLLQGIKDSLDQLNQNLSNVPAPQSGPAEVKPTGMIKCPGCGNPQMPSHEKCAVCGERL